MRYLRLHGPHGGYGPGSPRYGGFRGTEPPPVVPGAPPTPRAQRIFGLPAPVAVRVALPIIGGLLAAFAAVWALKPGRERWATVAIASWALLTAATSAAEALQSASEEYDRSPP